LLVTPAGLRPLMSVIGALYAIAIGCFLLILSWHMPSDVLGGYLLAALYGSLAIAALRAAEQRSAEQRSAGTARDDAESSGLSPRRPETRWRSEDLLIPAGIVLGGVLATAVVVLVRAGQVASFAGDHRLVLASAAGIAALAALICSSLTLVLER